MGWDMHLGNAILYAIHWGWYLCLSNLTMVRPLFWLGILCLGGFKTYLRGDLLLRVYEQ
jgi:hypothetical protein